MVGPFIQNPLPGPIAISPINSVPKGTDARRIIVDLSFPKGAGVNAGIVKGNYLGEDYDLTFPTIDRFAARVKEKGRGALMYKRDLSRAYRQFAVCPGDLGYLGLAWGGRVFLDLRLAMGLSSAAMMCQRATSAVAYMMEEEGYGLDNYLDDFAGVELGILAWRAFQLLGELLKLLGLDESILKALSPSTLMEFLGILFDSINMTMSISDERLREILALVRSWLGKVRASKRELQSLVGKLQFVATCVPVGDFFLTYIHVHVPYACK